jgi:lysophospholipase L1-like esterase
MMNTFQRLRWFCLVFALLVLPAASPFACAARSNAGNLWENEIKAFEKADRTKPPPAGAVLFVGSSTIRMWKTLSEDFPGQTVINRGFGGCQIEDCTFFADRIIAPYAPRLVVLRAGGNDINAGKSPERVFADFQAFVAAVRAKLPKVRIAYMTINATPSRWANAEREKKTNRLIEAYIKANPALDLIFIDTFDATMGSDGRPRGELFLKDRLHFNADGYKILADRVRPFVK